MAFGFVLLVFFAARKLRTMAKRMRATHAPIDLGAFDINEADDDDEMRVLENTPDDGSDTAEATKFKRKAAKAYRAA